MTLQRRLVPLLFGALSLLAPATWAEDIDLFARTGLAATTDPNLLIILDNASNWNRPLGTSTRFTAAKAALVAALGALSDATAHINVGLMLFNEPAGVQLAGGQSTGLHDGAYVRYAVRTMTSAANRASLIALINSLDSAGDLGLQAQNTMAMEEARRYLGGLPILNGGNTGGKVDPGALDAQYGGYASPVTAAGCQKNIVLFISNGPPEPNDQDLALGFVRTLNAGRVPARLPLPAPYPAPSLPASQDAAANWMDEYAALIRAAPYPAATGNGSAIAMDGILTYSIAVHDPDLAMDNTPGAASGRALVLNAAIQGGGKYADAGDGFTLEQAIRAVFAEIQSATTAFVSPTLPVSVNPLGIYLNQVYMGMFRPDAANGPRWAGNLKQYQFAYNSSTGLLELVDALNHAAINASSGFITPTAQSFWSTARTTGPVLPAATATVDFFANAPAGTGLTPTQQRQEAPDGDVADKGGVAQQIRAAYLGDQSARRMFTCPIAGCPPGSSLAGSAAHAFDTSNLACAAYQSLFGFNGALCDPEFPLLIDWIRGADNTYPSNEAVAGPGGLGLSPIRPSVHGDVLHSRPVLINYGASGIVAFFGANDGTLRAVRAGRPASGGGRELWAFVAPETFSRFKRLRDAAPRVKMPSPSSGLAQAFAPDPGATPRDYFIDGAISSHEVRNAAGTLTSAYLIVTARRGGSFIYAFDVTAPDAPRFLWKHAAHDGTDAAFDDLALTFSGAKVGRVAGYADPVVIFGGGYAGGYDAAGAPIGEDADLSAPCVPSIALGCGNRIFVLDAATGNIVKTFQSNSGNGGDLSRGIAADLALVDTQGNGRIDRAYAADLGGAVWRIDFDSRDPDQWTLRKFAVVADAANPRKFLSAPDVVLTRKYAAILIGTGDREKPLRAAGTDRFYMFKDKGGAQTNNWPLDGNAIAAGNMADVVDLAPDALRDTLALDGNNGWFRALAPGEKVVNGALTAAGVVYFSTNTQAPPSIGTCDSNLGIARSYGLLFNTGTAGRDLNGDGVLDERDVALTLTGGGLPPAPIAGMVDVLDSATNTMVTVPFVIGIGSAAGSAAGLHSPSAPARIALKLSKARKKTYWYKAGQ